MVRNFRRSGQEPDLFLMSQGENAYLVLRGVFHVSPPALGGLSIDGKLTFSNNAYLKLPTEWIMLHGELANRQRARRLPVLAGRAALTTGAVSLAAMGSALQATRANLLSYAVAATIRSAASVLPERMDV